MYDFRVFTTATSRLLAGVIIAYAAVGVWAQPNEKYEKANALLAAGRVLADQGTEGSWKAAESKFEESYKLFIEGTAPDKKNQVIREVTIAFRGFGNTHVNEKRFGLGEKYLGFILAKVRAEGLRAEMAVLIEDLGNSSIVQGKGDAPRAYYEQALPIYIDVKSLDRAAFVHRQIGLIAYDEDKFDEAIRHLLSALKIYRELNNREKVGVTLVDTADSYFEKRDPKSAEPYYKEALAINIALRNAEGEAASRSGLGKVAYHDYRGDEAIKHLLLALAYYESTKNINLVATTHMRIGKAHMILFRYDDARVSLTRAAETFKDLKDPIGEGDCRMHLGNLELAATNTDAAKTQLGLAIDLFLLGHKPIAAAMARVALAEALSYTNEHDKAFEYALMGKQVLEKAGDAAGLNSAYRAIGWINTTLSRYDEAIRNNNIALKFAEQSGDSRRQADTIVNLGVAYSALGLTQEAISQYLKALDISKLSNNVFTEAVCLNNLGYNYYVLDDLKNARTYLEKAIPQMRILKMKREEGYALHNLGMVFLALKDYKAALTNYENALKIYIEVKDRRVEAYAYMSIGEALALENQWDRAIDSLEKAILLARQVKYADVEGNALALMMDVWQSRGQPRLAILYGKQAVNLIQNIRAENKGLEKNALAAYLKQNEVTYRTLADILVTVGRLPEAQQVLDLLKQEEYQEFVRRDAAEAWDQAKVALTDSERKALDEYSRLSSQLTSLGTRFQVLQDARVKADGKLPEADEAEFQKLKTQIEEAGIGIRAFLSKLAVEFSKTVEDKATITPESIETLRADLRRAGSDVVLVSTYLLPERYRAIVTTGRTMVDRKVEYKDRKLTAADVNRKIDEFRRSLQNPKVDPRPLAKELYDIFVKPLENDLRGAGAKTILWSLDGTLRYVPIAALSPDGKTYMAEHYQNVIVTLARQTTLFNKPSADEWRALGAGVSKPHEGFAALPSVINELNSIVRDGGPTGVLDGKKLVDEKFNLEAFRNSLPQETADGKVFNVVHLATHFKLGVNDRESALLLGDGKRLSLFDIKNDESLDFKDVELLALSACETGVATGDHSGREVESLGMLAQKKGAKAVMATLWKVADEGTSMFMSEFYRLKLSDSRISKAEAIRLTQKAMIDGKMKATGTGTGCRADDFVGPAKNDDFKCDPNAPFSHPYFWSPFVLIGNWR